MTTILVIHSITLTRKVVKAFFDSRNKTPQRVESLRGFACDRVCKPGSVIDSHLSRRTVAGALQPPSRRQPGKPCLLCGVAPDRVYSGGHSRATGCALTAPFHPCREAAVYFCCTFPEVAFGGRYPLSLPCGARTFLMGGLSALLTRLSDPVALLLYFILPRMSNGLHFCGVQDIISILDMELRGICDE